MKKLPLILLTVLALTLTACGASNATEAASTPQTDPANETLSGASLIAIGTLKLKDTPQAVTPDQAAELLPLWQVYQSLIDSDNAAQEEIDALVTQIEETMTSDQMQAINDMALTRQDMFAAMQEIGIAMGGRNSGGSGNNTGNGGSRPDGGNGGGFGPPGGGAPPEFGGGGPGGGQGMSPSQIATAQASRGSNGGSFPGGGFNNRIPTPLLEALIQYLQEAAGS